MNKNYTIIDALNNLQIDLEAAWNVKEDLTTFGGYIPTKEENQYAIENFYKFIESNNFEILVYLFKHYNNNETLLNFAIKVKDGKLKL